MGVSPASAETDSEGIEHHVSKETLAAMKSILKNGWPSL
jgi:DtxR family manganese transport transcriptional regulator